ncbi:hypothetical protein ABFY09_02170 [Marinomonas sp. 5E14-1]|uniref:hypothetical protein n=1 Tax=Marinomonas sp. 5E14-1 TaxID=3153922 RepID=UPI00326669A4
MLDVSHLTELSAELEQCVIDKDIEKIQLLCEENDSFIRIIKPFPNDQESNNKIKQFITIHQSATQLIRDVHKEMQRQLYITNKSRKGVRKYKGVKNA